MSPLTPDALDTLTQGLTSLGCQDLQPALLAYLAELKLWNTRYGLVNADSDRELVIKHILDSLTPLEFFRDRAPGTLADIGSGAGLPGIPLSLGLPHTRVTLVEKQEKRVRFLENTRLMNRLENIRVCNSAFERLSETFDLVTFRAFTPLSAPMVENLCRLLSPGGVLAAYKGRKETLEEELTTLQGLELDTEIHPLRVPFLEDPRHLVVLSPRW